jgi:hypothetical protein
MLASLGTKLALLRRDAIMVEMGGGKKLFRSAWLRKVRPWPSPGTSGIAEKCYLAERRRAGRRSITCCLSGTASIRATFLVSHAHGEGKLREAPRETIFFGGEGVEYVFAAYFRRILAWNTSFGPWARYVDQIYREDAMLKGIMKTAEAQVRLSQEEVFELSQLLTPVQRELIFIEGESVLIRTDCTNERWQEYWIGR